MGHGPCGSWTLASNSWGAQEDCAIAKREQRQKRARERGQQGRHLLGRPPSLGGILVAVAKLEEAAVQVPRVAVAPQFEVEVALDLVQILPTMRGMRARNRTCRLACWVRGASDNTE
jgi:hypothetical protein